MTKAQDDRSLFDQLGGQKAVNETVDSFYDKIIHDERINHFFVDVDMARQRAHQKAFLTYTFGGAPYYNGQSLRRAHARPVAEKGLSDEHFDAMADNLKLTMEERGIAPDLIEQAMALFNAVRDDVLNR